MKPVTSPKHHLEDRAGMPGTFKEVAPLGIGVTVVATDPFRTGFRGPESLRQSVTRIDDYADTAGEGRRRTEAGHGQQAGDPAKGARAIMTAVQAEKPPVQFLIGGDAREQFRAKLDEIRAEADAWEAVTKITDLDDWQTVRACRAPVAALCHPLDVTKLSDIQPAAPIIGAWRSKSEQIGREAK